MKKIATLIAVLALFIFSSKTYATDFHVNGSTGIDSSTCGAVYFPCKTVEQGVTNAGSETNVVKIAVGDYSEYIRIDDSVAGLTLQGGWSADFSIQKCDPNLTVLRPLYSEPLMELSAGAWRTISVDVSCLTFKGVGDGHRRGIDLRALGGSITFNMDQSIFDGFAGNGMSIYSDLVGAVDLTIRKSTFKNAYQVVPYFSGGGIHASANNGSRQTIVLENCLLFNNEAYGGAAIDLYAHESGSMMHLSLTNVTLTGNRFIDPDDNDGGGVVASSSSSGQVIVDVTNSIVWGNSQWGVPKDIIILQYSSGSTTVNARYSILGEIYNYPSAPGTYNDNGHNTNVNPQLNGCYHLNPHSPAIDAARCGYLSFPDYTRVAPYDDIDGDSRPGFGVSTGCDIGADEYRQEFICKDESLCFPVRSQNGKTAVICL